MQEKLEGLCSTTHFSDNTARHGFICRFTTDGLEGMSSPGNSPVKWSSPTKLPVLSPHNPGTALKDAQLRDHNENPIRVEEKVAWMSDKGLPEPPSQPPTQAPSQVPSVAGSTSLQARMQTEDGASLRQSTLPGSSTGVRFTVAPVPVKAVNVFQFLASTNTVLERFWSRLIHVHSNVIQAPGLTPKLLFRKSTATYCAPTHLSHHFTPVATCRHRRKLATLGRSKRSCPAEHAWHTCIHSCPHTRLRPPLLLPPSSVPTPHYQGG